MVGILPPCASYNSIMIHESNGCVLARYHRDSHTKSGQEQTWKKQMYVLCVSQRGLGDPLCYTKKCFNKGFSPLFSIHLFNVGLTPPPPRVGLPQGDRMVIFSFFDHPKKSNNILNMMLPWWSWDPWRKVS